MLNTCARRTPWHGIRVLKIFIHTRFGEFSQSLAGAGAELLSFPSAFTVKTGMAHWEPLLR